MQEHAGPTPISRPNSRHEGIFYDGQKETETDQDRPTVGFWPIGLREPLPVLPIPLAAPDAPVRLDLKAVLDRAYDAADYGKYIYQETPVPALPPTKPGRKRSSPCPGDKKRQNVPVFFMGYSPLLRRLYR